MGEYSIQQFTKYKSFSWYNAHHELYKGAVEKFRIPPGSNDIIDFTNASVTNYRLNGTGTSAQNRNNVILFIWANGVYVDCDYYITQQVDGDHLKFNFFGTFNLKGKDGHVIKTFRDYPLVSNENAGASLSSFPLYVSAGIPRYVARQDYAEAISGFYGVYMTPTGNTASGSPKGQIFTNDFQNKYSAFWFDSAYEGTIQSLYDALINNGDDKPISPIQPSDDTSTTGGGDKEDPDYNPFTDPIDFPNLPTYGPINTGLITAYRPSIVQLRLLANKLWSDDFINEIKKINNDPMEAVISLHQLPFHVTFSESADCKIGNYNSEISMPVIANQFLNISGGSFTVSERFASALDYSPYTSAHIHIPFVGIVPLDIDYVMKKTLTLNYQVDVLTGSAVAMLKCDNAILYTFPCNMAMTTPLTSSNHQALYREIIQTSASIGHTIVAGATGGRNDGGGLTQGAKASVGHGIVSSLESALNTVASKHSEVQKSGAITGVQGILDTYETYLIFHRPIQSLAQNFAHFKGFPCNITYTLSSLSGYTEVEYAHLEGVTATDDEKEEIQMLLQTGVIL